MFWNKDIFPCGSLNPKVVDMEILKFYNNIGITLGAQTLELGHKGLKKKKKRPM